jgi:Calx-beta domain
MPVDPGANGSDGTVTKIPWPAGSNDQITDICYQWLNTNNGTNLVFSGDQYTSQIRANEHYFDYASGTFTGNPATGPGVGVGPFGNRPMNCTAGVAYWATDQGSWNTSGSGGQGVLYKCTATNTWNLYYTPYAYPHPLTSVGATTQNNRRPQPLTRAVTPRSAATMGADYIPVNMTLNFADGEMSKPVNITIINDAIVEGAETFNITLSGATGATLGTPNMAVVTINDNVVVGPTITASPASIAPGGTITATWSGIVSPTLRDWIGLFQPGAADTAYIDWMYINNCSQTPPTSPTTPVAAGSCPFVLSASLPPGTYQLRLLANDLYNVLATSNNFTVAPVTTPTTSGFFFGRRR